MTHAAGLVTAAVELERAGVQSRRPDDQPQQLAAAGAGQPGHTEDLPRAQLQRGVLDPPPAEAAAWRRTSPRSGSHAGKTASMGRPAMAAMTPSTLVSRSSPSSTFLPLRRTVKRSAMSKTSSRRWET